MRFVKKIYTAGFSGQKIYTLNFTELQQSMWKKTQKMRENGEIYTAGKKITLPLALAAVTNLTSDGTNLCKNDAKL